jgi:hypothetical protein
MYGPGGGAAACGAAIVVAETLTTGIMLKNLGPSAVDRRLISVVLRTLATAAAVVALDFVLHRFALALHPWARVGVDAVAYVVLALATGSVRIADAKAFVQLARAQRAARGAAPT